MNTAEQEVREVMQGWLKALQAADADAIASHFADDSLNFDAHTAFQFKDLESYRRHLRSCMAYCPPDKVRFDVQDMKVIADGNMACCHFVTRAVANLDAGPMTVYTRGTMVLRKAGGKWSIIHGHASSPYDPQSSRVLHELTPEEPFQAERSTG